MPHEDHPRMCGEKYPFNFHLVVLQGSPPHVRGKVGILDRVTSEVGITPACAGKSCRKRRGKPRTWDHPRMCGEKDEIQKELNKHLGSPPHVRGKAAAEPFFSLNDGITPACAGKRIPA